MGFPLHALNILFCLFLACVVSIKLKVILPFFVGVDRFLPMTTGILSFIFHFHYTLNTMFRGALFFQFALSLTLFGVL